VKRYVPYTPGGPDGGQWNILGGNDMFAIIKVHSFSALSGGIGSAWTGPIP